MIGSTSGRWAAYLCLLLVALGSSATRAAESIELIDEVSVSFTIPAASYSNAFYFDVPAGARKFRLELDGTPTNNTDLDLFLRYGQPFPDANSYGLAPASVERGFEWLADLSHYQSISFGNAEFMVISEHSVRPPQAGRWHAAVVNFSSVPVNATLVVDVRAEEAPSPATISVRFDLPCTSADGPGCVCDLSGWNDPSPPLAAPGNTGTTLGEQRQIALREAVRRIALNFKTEAAIVIRACWADLEASATSAVLAQAGSGGIFINDTSLFSGAVGGDLRPGRRQAFLPESGAWYAAAPTSKSGGTNFCRISGGPCQSRVDVTATFNSLIDQPAGLGAVSFYYGLEPPAPNTLDFIGISMHEISHGLGFISFVSLGGNRPAGSEFRGRDDIFERQLLDTSGATPKLWSRLSDADRLPGLTSRTGLQWIGAQAVDSPLNVPRAGEPGVRIYAPNPVQEGSSLSHLDLFYRGELMVPSSNAQLGARDLFLAAPMLNAVGWDPTPRAFPEPAVPQGGQWYDRDRAGHGIDFQRVFTNADGYDIYSLLFYTYDRNGNPEWFLAIGPLIDGVFLADNNEFDQSLVAYLYQTGRFPPQRADRTRRGQIRLDFNQARDSFACSDGTFREDGFDLAAFTWAIDGESDSWCMEPLIAAAERDASDLTGTWYAGTQDQGWGASIATAQRAAGNLIFALFYYPDANGTGRWAFALEEDYSAGQNVALMQRRGYCRSCSATTLVDTQVGSVDLGLIKASQEDLGAGNLLGLDVTYAGAQGGRFTRPATTPFTLLSAPPTQQ